MRLFFILFLIFANVAADESKQKITLGLGDYLQTQPYDNVDDLELPSPVIFYDNGVFYVRWTRVGVYFLGEKRDDYSWGFSLTAQPRTYGYDLSKIGIDKRKESWEGGLAFSAAFDKAYFETMVLTDLLNGTDSWIVKTELGYDFEFGEFSFYPSSIVIYQSSKFLNYYYEVSANEAVNSGLNEYSTNDGFLLGVQTFIKYPITNKLSALINLRADKLPKEATDSPLVNKDYVYSGLVSLIYSFEY